VELTVNYINSKCFPTGFHLTPPAVLEHRGYYGFLFWFRFLPRGKCIKPLGKTRAKRKKLPKLQDRGR